MDEALPISTVLDMCEMVVDCPHFTPDWTDSGYIVIRNQNIRGGRLDLTSPSFTHEADFKRRTHRARPRQGDIIITREAPMGEVCLVPADVDCCLGQRQVLLRPKPDVDARYLHIALQSPFVRHQIFWNEGTGSTVSNIRIPVLEAIRVPRFGKAEPAIAATIAALDDKIELNRRMNETLEASARALFRDWFVDFGPTRAKAEGRPAYLAPDLWSLFPDRLDDDGVPEGWSETPLDQIAEFLNGLALQRFPAGTDEPSLPVIKIGELRSGVSTNSNRASTEVPAKYIVDDGDFLFSWSGSLLAKFWTEGAGALNQHLFKVTSDTYPAWFFSQWVWHHLAEFQSIAASKATTMGHIQRGHLSSAMTIAPPLDMLASMGTMMQPMLDLVIGNLIESRHLSATRDALLPKLMSGEIRVRDAEALAA